MRMNRKAGLLSRGVLWTKYECVRTSQVAYMRSETDWQLYAEGGVPDGASMTGYTDYFIDYNGKFFYRGRGSEITLTAPATGTLYRPSPDGTSIDKETWTNHSGVEGMLWYRTIKTIPTVAYAYHIGDEIGSVLAAKGEYPDSKKGYPYWDTDNGYFIRGDQDGNFYAYKKANIE